MGVPPAEAPAFAGITVVLRSSLLTHNSADTLIYRLTTTATYLLHKSQTIRRIVAKMHPIMCIVMIFASEICCEVLFLSANGIIANRRKLRLEFGKLNLCM